MHTMAAVMFHLCGNTAPLVSCYCTAVQVPDQTKHWHCKTDQYMQQHAIQTMMCDGTEV